MSIKQLATVLAVHENTIRNMIRSGRINAIRLSDKAKGHWRIPSSELNRIGLFDLNKLIDKAVERRLKEKDGK